MDHFYLSIMRVTFAKKMYIIEKKFYKTGIGRKIRNCILKALEN